MHFHEDAENLLDRHDLSQLISFRFSAYPDSTWNDWVHIQFGIDREILIEIEKRVKLLNSNISADTSLGGQYSVGHSYVTPPSGATIEDAREWFRQVVDTEIGPLLYEYWFDAADKVQKAKAQLLEGF